MLEAIINYLLKIGGPIETIPVLSWYKPALKRSLRGVPDLLARVRGIPIPVRLRNLVVPIWNIYRSSDIIIWRDKKTPP